MSKGGNYAALSTFFKTAFLLFGLLYFHESFRINLSIFEKRKEKKILGFCLGFH